MNLLKSTTALSMITALALGFSACSKQQSQQTIVEHAHDHQHQDHGTPHAGPEPGHTTQAAGVVQIEEYAFELAPEIASNGQTHLDLYIRDTQGQHINGANAVVHITAPDGHQQSVLLKEEPENKHYGAKTVLDHAGTYQAVAQITIAGKPYNPRFHFTREQ